MAYLLGSLPCMEALLEDVHDLQSVISEYVSNLGPLNCPSWKYPDQLAGDVNIDQLLTQYTGYLTSDSNQEGDARQVAHLALYELVIDRMVYVLHASAQFIIPIIKNMKIQNNPLPLDVSENLAGRNSVGLVVKQGWNLQKILQTCVNKLLCALKNKKQLILELEEKERNSQRSSRSNSTSSSPAEKDKSNYQQNYSTLSPDGSIKTLMSRDQCFKSSQTVETSFLPCEACAMVQESLRQTGKVVLQVCQDLGLPSRLSRYMSTYDNTKWMTVKEVIQWRAEQNKDLSVINRHIEDTFKPLKASLESLEKKCCTLENQKKALEKKNILEKETQEVLQKQSRKKLEDTIKAHQIAMNEANREKVSLESYLENLKQRFELRQEDIQKLKNVNKINEMEIEKLRENLKAEKLVASEVEELRTQTEDLKFKAEDFEKKYLQCSKELNQEQAKNKSITKYLESIQGKQHSTLKHIEKLSDENTDFQNQLAELQDSLDEKQEQIENLEKQQQQLKQQVEEDKEEIKRFSFEKEEMENQIHDQSEELKKMEERENLLVQYPDLNGIVLDESLCSGNVMYDMELQIKANTIRIELLEKQNQALRLTLQKVDQKLEPTSSNEQNPQPVSLWNMDTTHTDTKFFYKRKPPKSAEEYIENQNTFLSKTIERNFNVNSAEKNPQKEKNKRVSTTTSLQNDLCSKGKNNSALFRPRTANVIHDEKPNTKDREQITGRMFRPSSIKTYISLKQQRTLHDDSPSGLKEKSQSVENGIPSRIIALHSQAQPLTFVCKHCDKMYLQAKELKIHSLYCKD